MIDYKKMRQTMNEVDSNMQTTIGHIGTMAKDAERVSLVAKNANIIIADIDRKFEQVTKLTKTDIVFLFLAVALQVARQYFFTNFKERSGHNEAAKGAKKIENSILGRETSGQKNERLNTTHGWYHPSLEEVTFNPVPFDQTFGLTKLGVSLGGAFEHRAKTLGHDPILGYIFGTANIATSTLTTSDLQSFHVKRGLDAIGTLKPKITNRADTSMIFEKLVERVHDEPKEGGTILAISVFKEAIHLNSDINSKVSLPIPVVASIDTAFAIKLANYGRQFGLGFDAANLMTVGKQAMYSMLINTIIAMIHRLLCEEKDEAGIKLYEVRTRKILSYSNIIASASNLIVVAVMAAVGARIEDEQLIKKALSYLDIGGLMVTLYHIVTDAKFIQQIKQEFLEKEFYNAVMGDGFDF
jgi:hypothetical protein